MGIGEMMYEPWYNKFEEENRKAKEEHNKKIERQKNCQHKCHICKAPPGCVGYVVECMTCGRSSTIHDMAAMYFDELEKRVSKIEKALTNFIID